MVAVTCISDEKVWHCLPISCNSFILAQSRRPLPVGADHKFRCAYLPVCSRSCIFSRFQEHGVYYKRQFQNELQESQRHVET